MLKRFSEAAKNAFAYLEQTGFHLSEIEPDRLQYESAQAFLTIEWDARSGELNVFVGAQSNEGETRDAFSLSDLLSMENVDVPERTMPFQVADEDRLGPFLDKVAENVRIHAQAALAGDRMFYRRLKVFRGARAQTTALDMKSRRVRARADDAWRNREFDIVIALYASMENQLTPSETARLVYARKRRAF